MSDFAVGENDICVVFVNLRGEKIRQLVLGLAILLGLVLSLPMVAQEQDSIPAQKYVLPEMSREIIKEGRKPGRPLVEREIAVPADSLLSRAIENDTVMVTDSLIVKADSVAADMAAIMLQQLQDSLRQDSLMLADFGKMQNFNPDPNRALWMSLLFPGLGQVYNRRYWKLPIVAGGFVGLVYATSWNTRMHSDYTKAYRDAMDNDPNTKSYMDFYPPTTKEENINMEWLKKALKSKKDYFRRNKELCVISMVGLYMLCAVDAYVDASLMHFDISDDLSMRVKPSIMETQQLQQQQYTVLNKLPSVGVQCSVCF